MNANYKNTPAGQYEESLNSLAIDVGTEMSLADFHFARNEVACELGALTVWSVCINDLMSNDSRSLRSFRTYEAAAVYACQEAAARGVVLFTGGEILTEALREHDSACLTIEVDYVF